MLLQNTDNILKEIHNLVLSNCIEKDEFYDKEAQLMLTIFLAFFYWKKFTFWEALKFIKEHSAGDIIDFINKDTSSETELIKPQITLFLKMSDLVRINIFKKLLECITNFISDNDLRYILSNNKDCITLSDIESGYDIYCHVTKYECRWKGLINMFCSQLLNILAFRIRDSKPILFLIDDFVQMEKINFICQRLPVLYDKNVHIVLLVQSVSQLSCVYGKMDAEILLNMCSYKLLFRTVDSANLNWYLNEMKIFNTKINSDDFRCMKDIVCISDERYIKLQKIY